MTIKGFLVLPRDPLVKHSRFFASQAKLPGLLKTVKQMEKRLDELAVQEEQEGDSRAA